MENPSRKRFPYLTNDERSGVTVTFKEFLSAPDSGLKILREEGYLIVDDVISDEELRRSMAAFGRDLQNVCDMEAKEIGESPNIAAAKKIIAEAAPEEIPMLWPGGYVWPTIACSHGIPQAEFSWHLRVNPNVRKIFGLLHDTPEQDLVVGVDTPYFKPRLTQIVESTELWAHVDLNVPLGCKEMGEEFPSWKMFQSILTITPSLAHEDSSTVMWPKSHIDVFPYLQRHPELENCGHFVKIELLKSLGPDGEAVVDRYLNEAKRIPLKPGSLVVWDSRTIHEGWPGGRRLALPICWEPRSRRPPSAYARKVRVCASGTLTTSWASFGKPHNLPLILEPVAAVDDERGPEWVTLPRKAMTKLCCFRDDVEPDMAEVRLLCQQLQESGDCDETTLAKLESLLKSEILAIL